MGGLLQELGMLGRGLMSKSGNAARILAREADTGLARRFVPPATAPMAAPVAPSGIDALHASPHDFQKFEWSPRTRGTGEGAQAYGEGLYFAENPATMEEYYKYFASRNDPSPNLWKFIAKAQKFGQKNKGNPGGIDENMIRDALEWELSPELKGLADDPKAIEAMRVMANYDLNTSGAVPEYMLENARYLESVMPAGKAHRYAVKLKADPERFIDWDAPLSEQPHVLKRFENEYGPNETGERLYRSVAKDPRAKEIFNEAGIPGIKYLDAGSRVTNVRAEDMIEKYGSRQKALEVAEASLNAASMRDLRYWDDIVTALRVPESRNYVVWDDNIIEVVKKYGIAGALGAGLITQEMADQMRAQGVPDAVSHKTSPAGPSAMPNPQRFGG